MRTSTWFWLYDSESSKLLQLFQPYYLQTCSSTSIFWRKLAWFILVALTSSDILHRSHPEWVSVSSVTNNAHGFETWRLKHGDHCVAVSFILVSINICVFLFPTPFCIHLIRCVCPLLYHLQCTHITILSSFAKRLFLLGRIPTGVGLLGLGYIWLMSGKDHSFG